MPGDYIALYEKSATVYSVLAGSLGLSIRRLLSTDSFWPTDHSSAKNLSLWITLLRELFSILFSIYTWFERIEILKIIHVKIIHVKLRIPCLNFLKKKNLHFYWQTSKYLSLTQQKIIRYIDDIDKHSWIFSNVFKDWDIKCFKFIKRKY